MAVIGLIPARGGSKGIPGKNIALCAGKPLLNYTAEAALAAEALDRVILSTDDQAIAEVGLAAGVEVPFLRPTDIASDHATSLSVMVHALDWLESNGEEVDAIVLLQPTSPLRNATHIDSAIEHFRASHAETLVSVVEVPHRFHPQSIMQLEAGRLRPLQKAETMVLRRQDLPVLYARNGPAILIMTAQQIRTGNLYGENTVPFAMTSQDSLDIDTPEDLLLAEVMIQYRKNKT